MLTSFRIRIAIKSKFVEKLNLLLLIGKYQRFHCHAIKQFKNKNMWSLVGNNIVTLPFFWAELKILKGEWILDLNGFGNTQHANAPLNPPYTAENKWGL